MPATLQERAATSAKRVSAEVASGIAGWPILGSIAALVTMHSQDRWKLDAPVYGPWWGWLSLGIGGGLYHLRVLRMEPTRRRQILATAGLDVLCLVVEFVVWRARAWTDGHPLDAHAGGR